MYTVCVFLCDKSAKPQSSHPNLLIQASLPLFRYKNSPVRPKRPT